jgi:hypothetical protein
VGGSDGLEGFAVNDGEAGTKDVVAVNQMLESLMEEGNV